MILVFYQAMTALALPLIRVYLRCRQMKHKEDPERIGERLGHTSVARPPGELLWIHAASVGEAHSVQPLIAALQQVRPRLTLLLTTGTVTSARLMAERLPHGVIHQYVPVDVPQAVARFLRHWRPRIALFVESELWPNLLAQAHNNGCRLALVNARMSEKSFRRWNQYPWFIRPLLEKVSIIYAQSADDAKRYQALGASEVEYLGNLKYDAAPLAADTDMLTALGVQIGRRPVWLAASVHPGEIPAVARAHSVVRRQHPELLTVIVPRHPDAAAQMQQTIETYANGANEPSPCVRLRSQDQHITLETAIYIADTMGELGVFYRLCPLVFVGGSLIPHGGQNPLEPARLGCTILAGPHMFNFADIVQGLREAQAMVQIHTAEELAQQVLALLGDNDTRAGMSVRAREWVTNQTGVTERLLARLLPLFDATQAYAA